MKYNYLFGPVPSRRLNISLGVDIIPHKVCNLNCVYCESGITTLHTNERKEYLNYDEVILELSNYLSEKPELDHITFSGAGEPTLNSGLGKVIDFLKTDFPEYKIALITNGVLLADPEVRKEIIDVDVILPSLDAVSDEVFKKINRPVKEAGIKAIAEGLINLRKEFKGEIWLEVFIAPGYNDDTTSLLDLKNTIEKISPDKIQINSLDRPGTDPSVKTSSRLKLEEIRSLLQPLPNIEIVSRNTFQKHIKSIDNDTQDIIMSTIKRRPCNFADLKSITGIEDDKLTLHLDYMIKENLIEAYPRQDSIFYRLVTN